MAVRALSSELAKKAKEELNEDPQVMNDSLEHIKGWIRKQPHLHNNIRIDDQWLVIFLRGCKYRLETVKMKLDVFNRYRLVYKESIQCIDPFDSEIQKIMKSTFLVPTRVTKEPKGKPIVYIYRMSEFKGLDVKIDYISRVSSMVSIIMALHYDDMTVSGQCTIIDTNVEMNDIIAFINPTNLKKTIVVYQDAWPVRLKGIHFINMSSIWDTALSIAKMFLNEKTRNRLFFHKDSSTLCNHFSLDELPNEYGGTAGTFEELAAYWKQEVESHRDYLIDDMKYKSDESKRPQPSSDIDYELKGSFRKLDLD